MIGIYILLTIIIFLLYWKLFYSKYGDIDKLPGPSSFELFRIMQQSKSETLDFMLNAPKKYGGVMKLWIKPFAPMVLITDADVVMNVLKSPHNLRKTAFYKIVAIFFGHELGTQQSVVDWKHDRKEISPCFANKILKDTTGLFERHMDGLFKNIRKSLGQPVDFGQLISLYTMSCALELTTRKQSNFQERQEYKYINLLTEAFNQISERTGSFILQNDFFYKFTKGYKEGLLASESIKAIVSVDKSHSNGTGDVLDLMVNNNVPVNRKHDQLLALFAGAHDTTKSSMSFTVYEISRHPEVQKKLLQETIDLLGTDKSTTITYDLANRMNYMKCVIHETLRLYPTVPLIQRILGTDMNVDGLVIPKETNVTISLVGMQRDKKHFENPLEFDPDRFLPENRHKIPNGAFSPFSAGARDCLGKQYALLKMCCTIGKIIRNFEILPDKDHKLDVVLNFVSTSKSGFNVVFRERGHLEELIK